MGEISEGLGDKVVAFVHYEPSSKGQVDSLVENSARKQLHQIGEPYQTFGRGLDGRVGGVDRVHSTKIDGRSIRDDLVGDVDNPVSEKRVVTVVENDSA